MYLSEKAFINGWNRFYFPLQTFQKGIFSEVLDVVYCQTNQEVVHHDGDDNDKEEDDDVGDDILLSEGVSIFQFPDHHWDWPDKGLRLCTEVLALDDDEDEGEAEEGGEIEAEEEENILSDLKIYHEMEEGC